jgi:hypothetical protein
MRLTRIACAAVLATALIGCSKGDGPVVVTPEMEAEQKQEEKNAYDGESARQKLDPTHGPTTTAEDQERARQRQQQGQR